MITEIIAKLQSITIDGKAVFLRVEEAIDMNNAMKGVLKPSPVAFVVELSRRPANNSREMGFALQQVTTTVGVIVGISKINDPLGTRSKATVAPILEATRKALFGFTPTNNHEPLLLASADTIGVTEHALWQLERFTTEHYEEASNG